MSESTPERTFNQTVYANSRLSDTDLRIEAANLATQFHIQAPDGRLLNVKWVDTAQAIYDFLSAKEEDSTPAPEDSTVDDDPAGDYTTEPIPEREYDL